MEIDMWANEPIAWFRRGRLLLLAITGLLLIPGLVWAQALPNRPAPVPIADLERGADLIYGPTGCMDWGWMSIASAATLIEVAEEIEGTFYIGSSGLSGLHDERRMLLPEVDTHDALLTTAVLAEDSKATRLVLEPEFPVLVTPYDTVFQYPYEGHVDWLEVLARATNSGVDVSSASVRRVSATLARYTLPGGQSVLSVELPGAPEKLGDLTSMSRVFAGRGEMLTEDDAVELYLMARPLRPGPRVLSTLQSMRSERAPIERDGKTSLSPRAPLLVVPGGPLATHAKPDELELCAKAMARLEPTALVPRAGELALGPDELAAVSKRHELRYLAANLKIAGGKDARHVFKRYVIEERDGLQVAIIGLVGSGELEDLPVSVRAQWLIEDPGVTFTKVRRAIDKQLGRRPDLTVVLVGSSDGDVLTRMNNIVGADVVIGSHSAITQMGRREHQEVIADGRGREGVRFPKPLVRVPGPGFGVGRISARFGPGQRGGRARLSAVVHEHRPVKFEGPRDESYGLERRAIEEQLIAGWNQVMLPDVAPIVQRHAELQDLVYGEAVLYNGHVRPNPRSTPASFTDRLWMRLVTNVLREQLGADVAISRNLRRQTSMIGPLQRFFTENWLRHPDAIRQVRMSGGELLALTARLANRSRDPADPRQIFSAGLDPITGRVGGRPTDPKHTYEVLVTDQVLSDPEFAPLFAGRVMEQLFVETSEGGWGPDQKGKELTIGEVVSPLFESWLDPKGDTFDPKHVPTLEALLLDHSKRYEPRWHLQVDELSVRGSSLGNTSNVGTFAASKETRVNTPEHFSIGFRSHFGVKYDGPDVLWDNRVAAQLQRQEFSVDGQPATVQEAADDLVLSSELRFSSVKIDLGEQAIPLVPYIQASYDTEFTAIESPTEEDPAARLPHQHVVRAAIGQVMTPGNWLKEVRLGALFQEDFSEEPLRYDGGLVTGMKIELPLLETVTLKSQLDIRYLFPDSNDTESDLGLVLTSVSQLVIPVTSGMNLLVFADYYLVQGKLESNRDFGGSQVYGLGLDFARYFRL